MKKIEPEVKRLYRSRKDKIIAGVCGGIAEYFNIDPVIVRLAFVLLTFLDGIGILFYIMAWIVIPKNPHQKPGAPTMAEETVEKAMKKINYKMEREKTQQNTQIIAGIVFVLIGIALLFKYTIGWIDFDYVWPSIVIFFGIILLWRGFSG